MIYLSAKEAKELAGKTKLSDGRVRERVRVALLQISVSRPGRRFFYATRVPLI